KMRDRADLGPVFVNLRVNAVLRRDLRRAVAAGVVVDLAVEPEDEDLIDARGALFDARPRRHQHHVGPRNPQRDMAEEPDRLLHVDDAAHAGELAPPRPFVDLGYALLAGEFGHVFL